MDENSPQRPTLAGTDVPLPAERAFVVQLRAQTDPSGNLFVGRVEHIASGTAERFGSADALIEFITKVLTPAESGGEPSPRR
jgi:hypothetical protein